MRSRRCLRYAGSVYPGRPVCLALAAGIMILAVANLHGDNRTKLEENAIHFEQVYKFSTGLTEFNENKTKLLKICLFAANTEKSKSLVHSQLHTFANESNIWYVSHADIPSKRVIRLGEKYETGGYESLPKKTFALFSHLAKHDLDLYDFFMKADDDTYINIPRLEATLRNFNPEVPLLLGSSRFGIDSGIPGIVLGRLMKKGVKKPNSDVYAIKYPKVCISERKTVTGFVMVGVVTFYQGVLDHKHSTTIIRP
eukprot:m.258555 g.258555  ORF g.258555 m.258555 type:complete len:254 (-) comp16193_c0_seq9:1671-2432(-)